MPSGGSCTAWSPGTRRAGRGRLCSLARWGCRQESPPRGPGGRGLPGNRKMLFLTKTVNRQLGRVGGGTGPSRTGAARGATQGSPRPESSRKSGEENQLLLLHLAKSCPGPSPTENARAPVGDSARPWDPLPGWGTGQGQGVPPWGQPWGLLPGKPSPGEPQLHHTPCMRLSP